MTVEFFNIDDFEAALPTHKSSGKKLWVPLGLQYGEYAYKMRVQRDVNIMIRSSIRMNGWSAEKGEDSIRAWLVDDELKPLGSKTQKWVTRQPGWQKRLIKMLRELYARGMAIESCPTCHKPKGIFKVKKAGANKGRLFQKCVQHNGFAWVS